MHPSERYERTRASRARLQPTRFSEADLQAVERQHPSGMSVQEIVDVFTNRGDRLTEATFRKYVQLGLLPRSVRVRRKGKQRGSQGLYPATAVRQLDEIRRLMHQGYTIDEIQKEFLFVRGDIDALRRQMERVYVAIDEALDVRASSPVGEGHDSAEAMALSEARRAGQELVSRLEAIESRLTMRARMARAVV